VRNPAHAAKGRTKVLPFVFLFGFGIACTKTALAVAAVAAYLGVTSGDFS
jgi:hypothetical protein